MKVYRMSMQTYSCSVALVCKLVQPVCCIVQARTEAEHMRLEVRRLESSLDRKEVQLMELQVGKYARPFVNLLRLCLKPPAVELTRLSRVWPASGSPPKLPPPPKYVLQNLSRPNATLHCRLVH